MKWRQLICLGVFSTLFTAPAVGQTFTGAFVDSALFSFSSAAGGQYSVTLTWRDSRDSLSIALVCDDDQGDPVTYGLASGNRDRIARLSIGIVGERPCVIGILLIEGSTPSYTINFAATTATNISKAVEWEIPERTWAALTRAELVLRSIRRQARREPAVGAEPLGPTRTFLEQIRGGRPETFVLEVEAEGLIQITAMWNRRDTDLRLTMTCSMDDTDILWGMSETGQERFLRFDADLVVGTTCEVVIESPNTMVYALNFAFLGDGGMVRF